MLHWLGEKILSFHLYIQWRSFTAMIALFLLLSICFLISRRMNGRAEAPSSAPRLPPRLAQALLQEEEPSQKKQACAKRLLRSYWLVYDKLKLLPDARTGRRLNFFLLLLISWSVAFLVVRLDNNGAVPALMVIRNYNMAQAAQVPVAVWNAFSHTLFYIIVFMLPFFFVRKNREFYLDFTALCYFTALTVFKLSCWDSGCCFGIPSAWGVYNSILETTVFPVQIVEFAAGAAGVVFYILYMLFAASYRPGRGCSFCLFFYLASRFFADYLRYRGEGYRQAEASLFFGLTSVQIVCVAGAVVALGWLLVLPLWKKTMDQLLDFTARHLRAAFIKLYFSARFQPFFAKHFAWLPSVFGWDAHSAAALEEVGTE